MKFYKLIATNFLLTSVCFSTLNVPKYEDIFNEEIYDQSSLKLQSNQSIEEVKKNHLYDLKERAVDRFLAEYLNKKTERLLDLCETEKARLALNSAKTMYKKISSAALNFIPVIGSFLADCGLLDMATVEALPRNVLGILEKEITEADLERDRLKKGIKSEPINKQEEQYVINKSLISKELQEVIEKALIQSRKRGFSINNISDFLDEALLLPTIPKSLLSPNNRAQDLHLIMKRFEDDSFFRGFTTSVRKDLKSVIASLAYASADIGTHEVPLKNFYYFWGDAGMGKSLSARNLALFLDLPYYEAYIRSETDLSQGGLEGSTWYRPDANIGWVARPLLAKDSQGRTYKNSILIINDFDRILLNNSGRGGAALGFLLDYLDALKKYFYSPYFRSSIDISRLTIILSGNKPIPEGDGGPTDTYAALRTRLKRIHFTGFDEETTKKILESYSQDVISHFYLSSHATSPEQNQLFIDYLTTKTLRDSSSSSMRKLKNLLHETALTTKLALIDNEDTNFMHDYLQKIPPQNLDAQVPQKVRPFSNFVYNLKSDISMASGLLYKQPIIIVPIISFLFYIHMLFIGI